MSEAGGRYQRSTGGMIGAMLVTLGLILAFVAVRAVNRDDPNYECESIDYLSLVDSIQEGRQRPVAYPPKLPRGWKACTYAYEPGGDWGLNLQMQSDHAVLIRQSSSSMDQLVDKYVDAEATKGPPVKLVDSELSKVWQTFTDSGGDYAVAAMVGKRVVLVLGTANTQSVRDLAESLTMRKHSRS